jgi:D-aminopeptidase
MQILLHLDGSSADRISLLFQSAIESTEEAIYNSLCMAETMTGTGGLTIPALPFSVVEK